tara:strand:- start:5808 stop:6326 length:519 start_codon:yes stop_codon:yes gene_type:complete
MKLKIDTSKLSEATQIELLLQQPLETLNGLARLLDVKRGRSKVALVKGLVISNKLTFAVDMGLGIKSADDQKFIGGGVTSAEFNTARDNILRVTKVETIPASEIAKIKAMVERKEPLPLSKPLPKKVTKKRRQNNVRGSLQGYQDSTKRALEVEGVPVKISNQIRSRARKDD